MTLQQYKNQMRAYRGYLLDMDEELSTLFFMASDKFREYSLHRKDMGITKMTKLVFTLDIIEQDMFLLWLYEKKRNRKEIDLKLSKFEDS